MARPEPVAARQGGIVIHPETSGPVDRIPDSPLHLAVGMFDGVHLGHQRVIGDAVAQKGTRGRAAVLTFDPHPSHILNPARATQLLMPIEQRIHEMLRFGADHVFVQEFTREYARMESDDFLPDLKRRFPALESIHVGENFRFGARRSGDITTLVRSGKSLGIRVHSLERKIHDGHPVSSSRIRSILAEGGIIEVNTMLGRPYTVEGLVTEGRRIGRTIGFPTINLPWNPQAAPRFGVYQVAVKAGESGEPMPGIANYGVRPTVGENDLPVLEVHLFDCEAPPSHGESLRVALLDFIRPEKQFESVESLKRQIRADAELVKGAISSQSAAQLVDF